MNYITFMQNVQSFQEVIGYLPYEILVKPLISLSFSFDYALNKKESTARSPPSAYSITMQRLLVWESKKALW